MKTKGTYFQNSKDNPIVFGEIDIHNIPRRRLRGEVLKEGVICKTVFSGFCGTDFELMHMGERGELKPKFPEGFNRLINGHEGVVFVPSENRFAIVLIRGGNSYDPTRYMDDETYFEYGCDKADGLMCYENYYNPDMLLHIPDKYIENGKIPLTIAKRLVFADPYACMIFQLERMEDLGAAQNFRVEMAKNKCSEEEARNLAKKNIFNRVVIFGLGTTGMFIGDLIHKNYPEAHIVFVGRSSADTDKVKYALEKTNASYVENNYESREELAEHLETLLGGKATCFIGVSGSNEEHKIAFEYGVLGNNGIYNSFSLGPQVTYNTMPFGFKNHLIFGSINFRQDHMEKAIELLCESDYDSVVELIDLEEVEKDPKSAYVNKIYCKSAPMKTATVWDFNFIDMKK
jgi:threonine dehydrogenase-like Zn-dependent dehydrogenase